MNDADLEVLTREIIRRISRDLVVPELRPATVTSAPSAGLSPSVHLDGDDPGNDVDVQNLTGQPLFNGARVMVLLQPPRAGFVVGMAEMGGGWALLDTKTVTSSGTNFEAASGTDLIVPDGPWTTFRIVMEGQRNAAGQSGVVLQPNADAGATNYRRHRMDVTGAGVQTASFSDGTTGYAGVLWGQNLSSAEFTVVGYQGGNSAAVSFHSFGRGRNGAAAADVVLSTGTGSWLLGDTITSFALTITSGFTADTQAWLYGA